MMEPRDPDWRARVERLFHRQGIMATLGGEILSCAPGEAVLGAAITPAVSQQHGYAHAGLAWTLGDSACGFAAQTLLAADQDVLTIEMKVNLLAPAQGDRLIARGTVIKPGRRLCVARADVFAEAQGRETHIATMLGSMMIMTGLA